MVFYILFESIPPCNRVLTMFLDLFVFVHVLDYCFNLLELNLSSLLREITEEQNHKFLDGKGDKTVLESLLATKYKKKQS